MFLALVQGFPEQSHYNEIIKKHFDFFEQVTILEQSNPFESSISLNQITQLSPHSANFEPSFLIKWFSNLFQIAKDQNLGEIFFLVPPTWLGNLTRVILGQAYLKIFKSNKFNILLSFFTLVDRNEVVRVVHGLSVSYINIKGLEEEIERMSSSRIDSNNRKRRLSFHSELSTKKSRTNEPRASESRKLQESYLICAPSEVIECSNFKKGTLGSLIRPSAEKELYGRVYGLNWTA
jgi:hypothetical protein